MFKFPGPRDESGISEVLGAILVLGMIISVGSVIYAQYIQSSIHSSEADHMNAVGEAFIKLKSSIAAMEIGQSSIANVPMNTNFPPLVPTSGEVGTLSIFPGIAYHKGATSYTIMNNKGHVSGSLNALKADDGSYLEVNQVIFEEKFPDTSGWTMYEVLPDNGGDAFFDTYGHTGDGTGSISVITSGDTNGYYDRKGHWHKGRPINTPENAYWEHDFGDSLDNYPNVTLQAWFGKEIDYSEFPTTENAAWWIDVENGVSPETLYAHQENTLISGTNYRSLNENSADKTGTNLSVSTASAGRQLWGRFVYPLDGISAISASTWTDYYRSWYSVLGISFIGSASSTGSNPTSGSFSLPSGWAVGDVAVFWWYTYDSTKTFTPPSGVTQKRQASSGGYGRIYIGYRQLQSGDTTFGWTSSSVNNSTTIWGTSVFRGVDGTGDPFEAESGAPATFLNTNDPNPPAVTTVSSGAWVIPIFGKNNDYSSISPPTNYTSAGAGSSTSGNDASAGVAYIQIDSPTTEDPSAWTLGGGDASDDGYVWTGALKPDTPPAPVAHSDISILIRKSDNTIRQTIADNVAGSSNITSTENTYSGTYSFGGYTVENDNDYLEIDYYCHVTSAAPGTAYLKIDNNSLALADQTCIANVIFTYFNWNTVLSYAVSTNAYDQNGIVFWNLKSTSPMLKNGMENGINKIRVHMYDNLKPKKIDTYLSSWTDEITLFDGPPFDVDTVLTSMPIIAPENLDNIVENLAFFSNYSSASYTIQIQNSDGNWENFNPVKQENVGLDKVYWVDNIGGANATTQDNNPRKYIYNNAINIRITGHNDNLPFSLCLDYLDFQVNYKENSENYLASFYGSSGRLTFTMVNYSYPNQTYIYDDGAVIVAQLNSSGMASGGAPAPDLMVVTDMGSNNIRVDVNHFVLTGLGESSISRRGWAAIRATVVDSYYLNQGASVPNVSIEIYTAPYTDQAWVNYLSGLRDDFDARGYNPIFTKDPLADTGGEHLTLTIQGNISYYEKVTEVQVQLA